jgi:hypothetical protein
MPAQAGIRQARKTPDSGIRRMDDQSGQRWISG